MAGPGHQPVETAVFHRGPSPGLVYAGFWVRLVAAVVDLAPIVVIAALARVPGVSASCGSGSALCDYPTHALGGVVIAGALGVYLVAAWSTMGASIGQRLLGLRVVRAADGRRVSAGRALRRYLAYLVAAAPLAAGLIWAGFDAQKQGWHDMAAGTFVVRGPRRTGTVTGRRGA
jgi:uncharacterized RDD family membrane protein YckC